MINPYRAVFVFGVLWCLTSSASAEELTRIAGEYFVPKYEGPVAKPQTPLTCFRDKCRMCLFVEQAGEVSLDLTDSQVSSRYTRNMQFTVESAAGQALLRGSLEPGESKRFSFDAEVAGVYQLFLDAGQNSSQVSVTGARLSIPAVESESCRVVRGSQQLWFYVPADGTGFQVVLRGQGTAETAQIVIFDPQGKEVARGSTVGRDQVTLDVPVAANQGNTLWSLKVIRAESGVLEDASFSLSGDVGPYVAQRPQEVVVPIMRSDLPGVYREDTESKPELALTLLVPRTALKSPTISIRATSDGKEVFRTRIDDAGPGRLGVEFPAGRLTLGPHKLHVTLEDGGKTVSAGEHEFFVVRRPANLRTDKVTLHQQKPFFARGLYHVDPKDYELVKSQGFNIVQAHPDHVPACEAAGLNTAVALYASMRVNPRYYRQKIEQYKNSPAVVCWMIMDEPAAHNMPLELIQQAYGLIRALDADRPAYMCLCRPDAYRTYGLATDIIAIDVYPIREGRDDVSPIRHTLDVAQRDVPQQTVWFIGQVWSWPGKTDSEKRRLVTAAEHRCMSYLALTYGNVRGLMWYSFRDPDWYLPKSNPEVWAAAKRVNEELIVLEPVLLECNTWEKMVSGSGDQDIRVAMKEHEGADYLIAVNPNRESTEVRIPLGAGVSSASAEVLFENRTVAQTGGVLADRFAPLAVHVYKIPGQ